MALACSAGGVTGGCIALPVAALGLAGNISDIGNTAFSAGTEIFSSGKLESVEFTTFEHAQAAVRSTINDLRLKLDQSEFSKRRATYDFSDQADSSIRIDLIRRTSAICQIRIDIGIFGSEAYARLLLKSVRARLPIVARQSATQPTSPSDLQKPRDYPNFAKDDLDR